MTYFDFASARKEFIEGMEPSGARTRVRRLMIRQAGYSVVMDDNNLSHRELYELLNYPDAQRALRE